MQLLNVASYLKENPSAKVKLDGYADTETGTPEYNQQLSVKRAEKVKSLLTDKYKITSERITVEAHGSQTQPYEINKHNRVVTITIEEN